MSAPTRLAEDAFGAAGTGIAQTKRSALLAVISEN
jgi:hypothetical protein